MTEHLTDVEKLYRFWWRFNDKPSEGRGRSPADALNRLGYGAGAVRVLDYYEEVTETTGDGWDANGSPVRSEEC